MSQTGCIKEHDETSQVWPVGFVISFDMMGGDRGECSGQGGESRQRQWIDGSHELPGDLVGYFVHEKAKS